MEHKLLLVNRKEKPIKDTLYLWGKCSDVLEKETTLAILQHTAFAN